MGPREPPDDAFLRIRGVSDYEVWLNGAPVARGASLRRKGTGFEVCQRLRTGRIPEGVACTRDGRFLVVQCHPDRELRVYAVRGLRVKETGVRVKVPGMPSSLRAVP